MYSRFPQTLTAEALDSAALHRLSDASYDIFGLRFIVVHPTEKGWGQVGMRKAAQRPPFCRLIQGSSGGKDRCAMFHVLLNAGACGGKPTCQQCHAGAYSIVCPVDTDGSEPIAVVSTCFRPEDDNGQLPHATRKIGQQLHLDMKKVRAAHRKLPSLTPSQIEKAKAMMDSVAEVVGQIRQDFMLRDLIKQAMHASSQNAAAEQLKSAAQLTAPPSGTSARRRSRRRKKKTPSLPEVIAYIATHKPEKDYSVDEIAAAAGVTANHFSTQFHQAIGKKFSVFLLEKRMEYAKDLLLSSDMPIARIAAKVGYDDASYFTRRFRQATGMTPREWKKKHRA